MHVSTESFHMIPLIQYMDSAISLTTSRNHKTEQLERGAEQLKKVAREVYSRVHGWAPTTLRIAEP
jgi:hypothetical protein